MCIPQYPICQLDGGAVGSKFFRVEFFLAFAEVIEQLVKFRTVVMMLKVTKFVENYKIGNMCREPHKMYVEVDVAKF